MAVDTIATSTPATQTVADLGRLVKRKYPAYARIPDAELGRKVRAKYPAYRRFVDVPDTTAPDTVAPTPAATPAEAQVEPRRAIAEIRSAPAPAVAGPGSPPEFVRGFRGGLVGQNVEAVGRTAQAAADIAPMDALGGPVLGSALRGIARRAGGALVRAGQGQAQEAKVPSFKSVRSARELFDYLQFQAGQGIASTVPSVAGAAAGTLVAGPVVGAAVGAAVPAYALNFGDVAEEVDRALPKATASERAGISALIALPVTALDVLPSMRFGGKAAKKLMVQKLIAEASKRGLLERVLKEGGKGIAAEGVTEALQEVIQAVSVSGTAGKPLDQDELITRAVDAAIGGALAGGTIGGAIEAVPQRKGGPPSPASGPARPLANLASEEGRLRVQAPTPAFTPSVVEAAGVRANIEPPKNLSPQMAQTAREASIELGNTLSQIQQRAVGPVRFTDGGLKIEDAYIVPELVRVFPGDPNALRVTVVDRATGRMYSRALPNIGSLRSAMTVEAPREVSAAPAPTLPTEPLLPARGSVPVVEPEQVRAAAEGAKGRAVARAEADAAIPGRIAELKRLVAENPGDKRVKKWKRRIGRLERQIPGRATPTTPTGKETPSVLAKPATPVEESTKPAPASSQVEALARNLDDYERNWTQYDMTDRVILAERRRRLSPTDRKALEVRRLELRAERSKPAPPRPAPAAAALAPARPAQPSEPVRPTPAPSGTEAGGPAAARPRIIVPGHTFSDEATARRIAVAIARSTPDSDAKVVKTKKGYEIEVNEDAGVSRLKKTPAPVKPLAPVAPVAPVDLAPTQSEWAARSDAKVADAAGVTGEILKLSAEGKSLSDVAAAISDRLPNPTSAQLDPLDPLGFAKITVTAVRYRSALDAHKQSATGAVPEPAPATRVESANAPEGQRKGAAPVEAAEHPALRDVAIADMLSSSGAAKPIADAVRAGVSDEGILEILQKAIGIGGGTSSGRVKAQWTKFTSGIELRYTDEDGRRQRIGGPALISAIRKGLLGPQPKAPPASAPGGAWTWRSFSPTDLAGVHSLIRPGVGTMMVQFQKGMWEVSHREAERGITVVGNFKTMEDAVVAAESYTPAKRPVTPQVPPPARPLAQPELGGEVSEDLALTGQQGRAAPSGRSFVDEFEDLARQGMSLEEATAEAKARSGGEPPAGLDLETRWSRVRREAQEALGQTDMFGGAALLGGGKPGAVVAPETPAEREAPPNVSEAAPRAEKPSEPLNVPLEGLWYWQGFQNRDVPRGAKPTQNPSELVNAAHVRMLEETRGGFDIDEVVRRPILVWRDVAGELGEAGRRYVIDGHHRAFMALQTKAKKLPAVEVFGNLAYARDQARTANMASVPNTFSEQTRIAREIRERGDSWEKVAAQLRVRVARVKAMVDFAHLDPGVRSTYFPSGNETVMLNGTAHGETVGRYAREMPELMTVDMQRKWLDQAVNDDMKPTMFADEVRQFFSAMTAAKQEVMDVGGVAAIRLSMTPKQFAQTSGRLIGAIEAQKRQLNAAVKSLESVAEMARGKGHAAASDFVTKELADIGKEGSRLIKAHKEIKAAIHEALMAGMRGERDLATSFDAIQKRVDEIVGSAPPSSAIVGEEGFIRIPDLLEALVKALRRLSGIVRRDPTVKQTAKPRRFARPAVVEKILNALKVAKPVREEQEALHTAELAGRVRLAISRERGLSGLERHRARRSAMAGEFSKPDFESIAKALSTENVRELIDMIYAHPALDFFEHDNAVDALQKIVGDKGVEVPQPRELELLEIVFGTELVEALTSLRPQIVGARAKLYALANISKIMRTAYDLSAPLRQGLYFAARFPKQWGKAFVAMHRFWATEENFQEGMEEIWHRPNARLYRLLRLAITRPGSLVLTAQEEAFFGARLLYKVPGIRRSDRAYSGFLNQLRADVMDALIELAAANGHDLRPGNLDRLGRIARSRDKAYSASAKAEITRLMKVGAEIAALVNAGTGRGDSKFISEHAAGLNAMFFSARLIKSRLHLLNPKHYSPIWLKEGKVNLLNPHNYVRTTKFVRHEYIKSSVLLAGAAHMVLTLAGWAGAQIERERLNADFGKIRVGKNVYDILGGLIQYVRLYPAVTKAMWDQLSGKKPRYSAADLLWMFTEHKLSPIADFVLNWTRGWKMAEGGTKRLTYQDLPKDLLMLFVPMIAEDFFEVLKNDPRQLPVAIPASAYGVSVQSYDKPQPKGRRKAIRVAP